MYVCVCVLHASVYLPCRDKQQTQRTLRRQDKKIKEYQSAIDDERRNAEQYKEQVTMATALNGVHYVEYLV